jgi:uncharacterized damage-inducible protein DinB
MPFGPLDLVEAKQASRAHFLRHMEGLTEEQWEWKPYPECKSARETVAHMLWVDRTAQASMEAGADSDWSSIEVEETDLDQLRMMLSASHEKLLAFLKQRYQNTPLDTEVSLWDMPMKLGRAITYLSSEDYYHSGQIAFIRMATDPDWDYYSFIYS